jgi:hypothetical protein
MATTAGRVLCAAGLVCLLAPALAAQPPARRLTTIEALRRFPGYFHLQQVLLRGEFVERGTELVLRADGFDLDLVNPEEARRGPVEVRGQVIDAGRLEQDDARLGRYAERRGKDQPWPGPGKELLLRVGSVEQADPAVTPSVRAIALEPWKFAGQKVTVAGQFRGRNLFGDLPNAPGSSRFDFVLGGAEGALWITGRRPRGRGFDLDVDRRMDTNRWLEVTGVIAHDAGLVTLAATEITLTEPPALPPPDESTEVRPPPSPVEVVFSSPTLDETDVSANSPIRVQFSRGLQESSLAGRIRLTYLGARPDAPPLEYEASYDAANRALTIRFARLFDRFATVRLDLLEGITAFDGGPLSPWTLTFSVGGR